jgi:DNA/RNA-binding domain of Phe-tRNA-synthetase-like protein
MPKVLITQESRSDPQQDPPVTIVSEPHPSLRFAAFTTYFSKPLGELDTPPWLTGLLRADAEAPFARADEVRAAIRDMLRHGGYKPTGRGKPASEYLVRAASEQSLGTINLAVDACNAVSLHSAFPISVIDLDQAAPPFRIGVAAKGERYIFNRSGQEIDLAGLVCLFDSNGACGNAIKDAQRTKTTPDTRRTLSIIWGCTVFEQRLQETETWYRGLLERAGAMSLGVAQEPQAT